MTVSTDVTSLGTQTRTTGLVTRPCVTDGCDNEQVCRSLCTACYDRARRLGTRDQYPKMRGEFDTEHPAYSTVHARLVRVRGHASTHRCACGAVARDYSFDDDTTRPDTLWCPVTGRAYSADLDRYIPRCRRCHFAADGRRKYPPVCAVEDCTGEHKSYGFCSPHEKRYRRYGSPEFKRLTKAEAATLGLPA